MDQYNLGLGGDLIDAADTIADIWTSLSTTTANKVRVMQGLGPN